MPTPRHGKLTNVQIQDSGGVTRDISTSCRDVQFPRQADAAETSAFGTFDKTYVVGLVGSDITIQGMFDATVDGYLNGIRGLDIGGSYTGAFIYGPEGSATGRVKYSGFALCIEYSVNGTISDIVGFTAHLQITGAITRGVF